MLSSVSSANRVDITADEQTFCVLRKGLEGASYSQTMTPDPLVVFSLSGVVMLALGILNLHLEVSFDIVHSMNRSWRCCCLHG